MAEFDEAAHPRDEAGKFTDGGGGAPSHAGLTGATARVAGEASEKAGGHEGKVAEHKAAAAARRAEADKEADPTRRSEHLAQAAHHEARAAAHQVKADVEREVEKAAVRAVHPITEGLEHHAGVDRGPKAEEPRAASASPKVPEKAPGNDNAKSAHEAKLADMEKLIAGPKMSDKKLMSKLGVTHEQAHAMVQELRAKHGVGATGSLRDALREKAAKEGGEKKEGKEGGHGEGGGIGKWLGEKLEGAREKLEGAGERVGRVEDAALGEGGLGEAARVAVKEGAGAVVGAARGREGEE